MKKPVLVVMAAGMGSRYGGLKQLDPVGPSGQLIIDYSVYDAHRAGFDTVVFVIKREHEAEFRAGIGDRLAKVMDVRYAAQELGDLPEGYAVPEGRVKPWGTAQAVLAARHAVDGPFAVINSDDYYGPEAFREIYGYLAAHTDGPARYEYAMVGYQLKNTVTEHGYVSRGVCRETDGGYLESVTERTRIEQAGEDIRFTEDDGGTWQSLRPDAVVSMNLWGFTRSYLDETWSRFPGFLDGALESNPMKGEFYLPAVVSALIAEGKARVKVLHSGEKWYGVTYQADKPVVSAALTDMTDRGLYPENLWE